MKWNIVKQKWNLVKTLFLIGTSFWLTETIYFLIAYGWHWRAINEAENICDKIVSIFWLAALVFFVSVIHNVIEYLLSNKN